MICAFLQTKLQATWIEERRIRVYLEDSNMKPTADKVSGLSKIGGI